MLCMPNFEHNNCIPVADMLRNLIGKVYFSEQATEECTREKATYMFLDLLYRIESKHK